MRLPWLAGNSSATICRMDKEMTPAPVIGAAGAAYWRLGESASTNRATALYDHPDLRAKISKINQQVINMSEKNRWPHLRPAAPQVAKRKPHLRLATPHRLGEMAGQDMHNFVADYISDDRTVIYEILDWARPEDWPPYTKSRRAPGDWPPYADRPRVKIS